MNSLNKHPHLRLARILAWLMTAFSPAALYGEASQEAWKNLAALPTEERVDVFANMTAEEIQAYESQFAGLDPDDFDAPMMRRVADLTLIPPVMNTNPGPEYGYDQLDYSMTIGIERTPGGRLWAAWVAGEDGPDAFMVAATSDDDGETWSSHPRLVIDSQSPDLPFPRSVIVGALWTDPLGRLWFFFDQTMRHVDGRHGLWASVCENPDDDQPEWSKPRRIWHGVMLNKPTVLSTGEWLLPVYLLEHSRGRGKFTDLFPELDPHRGAHVFSSKDHGATWERLGKRTFPNPSWHETMIVERRDESLWMTARTTEGIQQSISRDRGHTWEEPSAMEGVAHPEARFHIRRLTSGRLLLVKHGERLDTFDQRVGDRPWNRGRSKLTAWLSEDDGQTWEGGLMLDERDHISYPDGTQGPDGTIYLSYDRERARLGEILMARITEEDILAGELVHPNSRLRMLIHRANHPEDEDKGGTDDQVSLSDTIPVQDIGWLEDFSYQRHLYTAQGKEVVAYTMEMKKAHVRQLLDRGLPWVVPTASADGDLVIGRSFGWSGEPELPPQPIFGYSITDPRAGGEKWRVVLIGGNHAREDPACWSLHGMIEFLVSGDPRARELREKVVFYVYPSVNPDGKWHIVSPEHRALMTINGNPELRAAGENNHNRVWNTDGRFTSIDTVKSAIQRDTGGSPEYLFDFHGIPWLSYSFACERNLSSPLMNTLRGRGINFRRSQVPGTPGMMRTWALDEEGLNADYAFTPELASKEKLAMLERGKRFALAFHDAIYAETPHVPDFSPPDLDPVKPARPAMAWLLEGNGEPMAGSAVGHFHGIEEEETTPFDTPRRSLRLNGEESRVDFGRVAEWDGFTDLTVSLWVRSGGEQPNTRYIVSRYRPGGDQRSWAITQMAGSRDILVTLSGDGSHDRDQIKRHLSTRWPHFDVMDATWRHLAFTFAGGGEGRLRLYVDGREIEPGKDGHIFDDSPVPELFPGTAPLTIGALEGSKNSFQGSVSEFAVWGKALRPEEILWLSQRSLRELPE